MGPNALLTCVSPYGASEMSIDGTGETVMAKGIAPDTARAEVLG
jgi:hypothetical protein